MRATPAAETLSGETPQPHLTIALPFEKSIGIPDLTEDLAEPVRRPTAHQHWRSKVYVRKTGDVLLSYTFTNVKLGT